MWFIVVGRFAMLGSADGVAARWGWDRRKDRYGSGEMLNWVKSNLQ